MTVTSWQRIGFGVVLTLASGAACAEKVENPEYKSWAAHKVGTAVTYKLDSEALGVNLTIRYTLIELTPEKAVVEKIIANDDPGRVLANHITVPAKVEKEDRYLPQDKPNLKWEVKTEKDTFEYKGKKYDAIRVEFTGTSDEQDATGKIWFVESLPGGIVKMQISFKLKELPTAPTVTSETSLVEVGFAEIDRGTK